MNKPDFKKWQEAIYEESSVYESMEQLIQRALEQGYSVGKQKGYKIGLEQGWAIEQDADISCHSSDYETY